VLENALDEFEGTVLVITHDRYLLDRVADRIAELEQGAVTEYAGNYTESRREQERQAATRPEDPGTRERGRSDNGRRSTGH
jgi:ATPase subunit of ABC transporter with duplicated ATPase domains